jgi:hypothetical protein
LFPRQIFYKKKGNTLGQIDDSYSAALKWANGIRARKGLEPLHFLPRGTRFANTKCPLARAIDGTVVGSFAYTRFGRESESKNITIPKAVNKFINKFDAGQYPKLNENL